MYLKVSVSPFYNGILKVKVASAGWMLFKVISLESTPFKTFDPGGNTLYSERMNWTTLRLLERTACWRIVRSDLSTSLAPQPDSSKISTRTVWGPKLRPLGALKSVILYFLISSIASFCLCSAISWDKSAQLKSLTRALFKWVFTLVDLVWRRIAGPSSTSSPGFSSKIWD